MRAELEQRQRIASLIPDTQRGDLHVDILTLMVDIVELACVSKRLALLSLALLWLCMSVLNASRSRFSSWGVNDMRYN